MSSKPSHHSVLSYWHSALLDDAQMKISFSRDNLVALDEEGFEKGQLPPDKTQALRKMHPASRDLAPNDSIIAMAGIRILLGQVSHSTEHSKQPALFCMAMLVNVSPGGTIQPLKDAPPWINRELLEPSDGDILIGDLATMDTWLQLNPFEGGSLGKTLEWAEKLWNAVTGEDGLPDGYELWERVALQPAEASIGMIATLHQRRFYDTVLADTDLVTPLLARYVDGGPEPAVVDESQKWAAAGRARGTMTFAYGMSSSQSEAMTAFCSVKDGDILAVNGPPGTGKTTLLQGIVATELVTRALEGGDPAVIVGTSTNNQAVTNIIDAMKKAMASKDSRPWARRWIEGADALGLYFPSGEKEKEALKAGYLIASPGRGLGTMEWKGFPERERDTVDAWASRDAWINGYYSSFYPGVTPPVRKEHLSGHGPQGARHDISLVEDGIAKIRARMKVLVETGRVCAGEARKLNQLYVASGYGTYPDITKAIAQREALLQERRPREDALKSDLKEKEAAAAVPRARINEENRKTRDLLKQRDDAVHAAGQKVEEVGTHAVALIAALPEGGFFSNLMSGRNWANVERLVAEGRQSSFFRSLMQTQVKSKLEWMNAINEMTASAERELATVRESREETRQARDTLVQKLEREVAAADLVSKTARAEYDHYVEGSYVLAGRELEKLVTLKHQILQQLQDCCTSIETVLAPSDWAAMFDMPEEKLPWRQSNWTGRLDVIEDFLDRTIRYALFQYALRYWEGRWVLEVQALQDALEQNDNKVYPFKVGGRAMEAMYRRWAMLTPLFIVTAASLPKFPKCTMMESGKFVERFMAGFFDLLIVDEAGQIAPYQMVPAMAFSKKAVVVGDVFQIEPVVTSSHATDTGNARKAGVQEYFWDDDGPVDPRVVTAAPGNNNIMGSVMRVVQTGTSHSSPDSPVPGIFLTEHRRCRRDIIEICNELVYNGRLKPMTAEPDRKPPLPPLAWANVNGTSERLGRSQRNPREAEAIARWIVSNADEWKDFYDKPVNEIVAVIAPYGPQRDAIRRALRKFSTAHTDKNISKIKVGTVNAMQGAERDIIIFSPTCDRKASTGFLDGKRSLLNVAISRAVHSFVVIGTMEIFERNPASALGILGRALFSKGYELGDVTGNWAANTSLILRGKRLSSVSEHHAQLDKALADLKDGEEIVIVSPFLSLSGVNAPELQDSIREAVGRGAVVNIVTRVPNAPGYSNGTSPACRKALEETGARLHDIKLLHSKTLMTQSFIAEGSFNWLSVMRDKPEGANLDTSWVLTGEDAHKAAREAIDELNLLLKESKPPSEIGHGIMAAFVCQGKD